MRQRAGNRQRRPQQIVEAGAWIDSVRASRAWSSTRAARRLAA
jgi:hypothetical protein